MSEARALRLSRAPLLGRTWKLTDGDTELGQLRWKWPAPVGKASAAADARTWTLEGVHNAGRGAFAAKDAVDGSESAKITWKTVDAPDSLFGKAMIGTLRRPGNEPLTLHATPAEAPAGPMNLPKNPLRGLTNRYGDWTLIDAQERKLIEFRLGSDTGATSAVEVNVLGNVPDLALVILLCCHALQYRNGVNNPRGRHTTAGPSDW